MCMRRALQQQQQFDSFRCSYLAFWSICQQDMRPSLDTRCQLIFGMTSDVCLTPSIRFYCFCLVSTECIVYICQNMDACHIVWNFDSRWLLMHVLVFRSLFPTCGLAFILISHNDKALFVAAHLFLRKYSARFFPTLFFLRQYDMMFTCACIITYCW